MDDETATEIASNLREMADELSPESTEHEAGSDTTDGTGPGCIDSNTWESISRWGSSKPELVDCNFAMNIVVDGSGDIWFVDDDGTLPDSGPNFISLTELRKIEEVSERKQRN